MHPAFYSWFKHRRAAHDGFGAHAGCDPWYGGGGGHAHDQGHAFFGGFGHGPPHGGGPEGQFGVRRPLRFLAHKLDLSEQQTADLARILDELKTERAQAEVDQRRTIAAFADAIEATTFGEARAAEGGEQRVESARRLRDAVLKALAQIHALLDDDQRKRFAYLVRTGVLAL